MKSKGHILFCVGLLFLLLPAATVQAVIYVDADAPAGGDGTSWATAYKYLKDALGSNREIWVAEGTYYPDQDNANPTGTGSRTAYFYASSNCKIYGGFEGTETSRNQRRIWHHETILSGDIGTLFEEADNVYHVIKNSDDTGYFDGFTITRGYADFGSNIDHRSYGGGAFGRGVFVNCYFTLNSANYGGAVGSDDMILLNCVIGQNGWISPGSSTGGIHDWTSGPTAIGCILTGRTTLNHGPAIFINCSISELELVSDPDWTWDPLEAGVINCIVDSARVVGIVGSGYTYAATLHVDYSNVVSDYVTGPAASIDWGVGYLTEDPQYESPSGVRGAEANLSVTSPCLDAGSNDDVPADTWDIDGDGDTTEKFPLDIAFKERFFDDPVADTGSGTAPIVDMGANERANQRLYVDISASSSGNGLSWAQAYQYLHDAITDATAGTEIWVAKGNYQTTAGGPYAWNDRNAHYELKDGVAIYGGFYGDETKLEQRDWNQYETKLSGGIGLVSRSDDSYHVVRAITVGPSTRLDGFTIADGYATGSSIDGYGGGVYTNSSPTFANCMFKNNYAANYGGAVYHPNADLGGPNFTNCRFVGGYALRGAGIYNAGWSTTTLTNCFFSGNDSYYGGAIYNYDLVDCVVTNCSFYGNTATNYGGAINVYDASCTIRNSIFWDNTAPNGSQIALSGSTGDIRYSNLEGGQAAINLDGGATVTYLNNITQNPLFADPDGADNTVGTVDDDLRLNFGSPCIDSASNSDMPAGIETDLAGNTRIVDDPYTTDTGSGSPPIIDMGAYEYHPVVYGDIIYVDHTATSGTRNGTSWANACLNLYEGLLIAAGTPTQVWVAQGTYLPDTTGLGDPREATFQLINGVSIYGGFMTGGSDFSARNPESYETILSGELGVDLDLSDNSYHVVIGSGTDSTAVLDGLTIAFGYADGSSPNSHGAGLYNDAGSPTIRDCVFRDNVADYGGAVRNTNNSNPIMTDCTFHDNLANFDGGAIHNDQSSPEILNCIFYNNIAQDDGACIVSDNDCSPIISNSLFYNNSSSDLGGAVWDRSNCGSTITNCTFYNNSAAYGGGYFAWYNAPATITNCIFWDNTAANGSQISCHHSSVSIQYCDVQGGLADIYNDGTSTITWGLGNIDVDPLFYGPSSGDFHLISNGYRWDPAIQDWDYDLTTSRCIDAGNPGFPLGDEVMTSDTYSENIRINMGMHGGMAEASRPPYDWSLLSDVNNDGISNLVDFAELSQEWLSSGDNLPCDFDRNGSIGLSDLVLMAENHLAETSWH